MAKKTPPMVAAIEGDYLYITGGAEFGMQVGDKVEIMKPARKIIHPVTKEEHGEYYKVVARATITHVMPKAAVCLRTRSYLAEALFGWGPKSEKQDPRNEIEVGDLVGKAPEVTPEPEEEQKPAKLTTDERIKRAVAAAKALEDDEDAG